MTVTKENEIRDVSKLIKDIGRLSSAGSDVRCVWDVRTGTVGGGGRQGRYVQQCKMPALINLNPALCRIHAIKDIQQQVTQKTSEYYTKEGKDQSQMSSKEGWDDSNLYISAQEAMDFAQRCWDKPDDLQDTAVIDGIRTSDIPIYDKFIALQRAFRIGLWYKFE